MVDFDVKEGSNIQGNKRPVIIISNDINNQLSSTVNILKLTTHIKKEWLPVHIVIFGYGLPQPSMALVEQIYTIDKTDLKEENFIGHIYDTNVMRKITKAVNIQLSSMEGT